ncbi:MAG TPA: TolC family protein [Ignavibacteria bacterium]|nr:TolC family protein [Ignavibacteria bacterium]
MKITKFLNILLLIALIKISFNHDLFSQTDVKMNINEIIKTAIENNQTIKSSSLNIKKENAVKLRSFNIPDPELFIEYNGIDGSLDNALERKIGIIQNIEFPTNYFLRSDVQNSQIRIAGEELNIAVNSLREDIKLNYNRLLLINELLEIAKDNLKTYEEFLFTAEKKYTAGATSNLEVLGAKVNKIKFENEIKNLESEFRSSRLEIRKLMNVNYYITPADEFIFRETAISKSVLVQSAVSNNPELKMTEYQKEKFSNNYSLSKSELLPDFSFKYFRQKIGSDDNYWGMELGLGIPLWFWWEPSGKIKESDYELQIASGEVNIMKNSIEIEIDKKLEEYENNLRQVKFFNEEAIKEADEILRQAKKSYEVGEIGYVEYLQALNLAYDTQTQYLNAIFNYNNTIINLEKITAGEIK